METDTLGTATNDALREAWLHWQHEHAHLLVGATKAQRSLLEALVRFVAVIAAQQVLLRFAAFFMLHAGMGLTPVQVGAAVGRTDRAMRTVCGLGVREMWAELGPADVARFIAAELSIVVDAQTIGRFFEACGVGILCSRGAAGEADASRPC